MHKLLFFISSFTTSSHVFFGLPLFICPGTLSSLTLLTKFVSLKLLKVINLLFFINLFDERKKSKDMVQKSWITTEISRTTIFSEKLNPVISRKYSVTFKSRLNQRRVWLHWYYPAFRVHECVVLGYGSIRSRYHVLNDRRMK